MSIPRPSKGPGFRQYGSMIRASEDSRCSSEAENSKNHRTANQQIFSSNAGIKSYTDARKAITSSLEGNEKKKNHVAYKASDEHQSMAKQVTGKAKPFLPAIPSRFKVKVGNINTDELSASNHGTSNDASSKSIHDSTAGERKVAYASQMASTEKSEQSKEKTFISNTEAELTTPFTGSETSFHAISTEPQVTTPISGLANNTSKHMLKSNTSPIRSRSYLGQEQGRLMVAGSGSKWRRRARCFQPYRSPTSIRPSDENAVVRQSTGPRTGFKANITSSKDNIGISLQQPLEIRPSASNTAIHDSKTGNGGNTIELSPRKDKSYDSSVLQHASKTNEHVAVSQSEDSSDLSLQHDHTAESNTNRDNGYGKPNKPAEIPKVKFDLSLIGHQRSKSSSSQLQPDAPEFVPRDSRIPKALFVTEYSTIPSIQGNPGMTQGQTIQGHGFARRRAARSDPGITSLKELQDRWEAQLTGHPADYTGVLPVLPRMHTFRGLGEGNSVITRQSNGPNWRQRLAGIDTQENL